MSKMGQELEDRLDANKYEMWETLQKIKKLCAGAAFKQELERQVIAAKCFLVLAKIEKK